MLQFYDTKPPEQMINSFRLSAFLLVVLLAVLNAEAVEPSLQLKSQLQAPPQLQSQAQSQPVTVLASLHPLALIAASVAYDVKTLVPLNITPHDFAFRPSDIRRLQAADIILWAGIESEPYLERFVQRWPDKVWIDISEGHASEGGDHNHDGHWWLSPEMAIRAQQRLTQALGAKSTFEDEVREQLRHSHQQLAPLSERGFFVFHQAYDHWVEYFDLNQLGSFTLSPEQKPGLRSLNQMRSQLARGDVTCVFTEPQFSPALVASVTRGLDIRLGELDPLGVHISVTKDGYAEFIRDLTQRFVHCLADSD